MTPEFMEKFDKVYATIMDKDFMQKLDEVKLGRTEVQHLPSSGRVKEYSPGEVSVRNYPKMKYELDSYDLKIKDEVYVGQPNPIGVWDDVPTNHKYMHKFLPEAGRNQLDIHFYIEDIWDEDRWILVNRMFGGKGVYRTKTIL